MSVSTDAILQEESWINSLTPQEREEYQYYWTMGKLPNVPIDRIYFVFNGAVRAWHKVCGIGPGRIYMTTEIHEVNPPIPMDSFRGFRYFKERGHA